MRKPGWVQHHTGGDLETEKQHQRIRKFVALFCLAIVPILAMGLAVLMYGLMNVGRAEAEQREYRMSPGCSANAGDPSDSTHPTCLIKPAIVAHKEREGDSGDFLTVVVDGVERPRISVSQAFYECADLGARLQVQLWRGRIVELINYSFIEKTGDYPDRAVDNYRGAIDGGYIVFGIVAGISLLTWLGLANPNMRAKLLNDDHDD